MPDRRQKRMVFAACTGKMNVSKEVVLSTNLTGIEIERQLLISLHPVPMPTSSIGFIFMNLNLNS